MQNLDESLVFLTVRGSLVPKTRDAARHLHNETAGSPAGIAAARALGDLSHKVYEPVPNLGAKEGELLFFDWWKTAEGIGTFFSDPKVHGMASQLFTQREATIWMPARGSFGFDLPAPASKSDRYVGIVRGKIENPERAIEIFKKAIGPSLSDARRRGQLSHQIFIKVPMPGDTSGLELLGVDHWCDAGGMQEHYGSLDGSYKTAFVGAPEASVWQAAGGGVWSEW